MEYNFITSYADIKKLKPATLRGSFRYLALSTLALTVNREVFKKPRVQFLYIHHIFKDEEDTFRELLTVLAKDHTFISYSDAVDKVCSGNIDKPYITFSSDDGLQNNIRAAAILNEFGASCCFFINPGIVGETDPGKLASYCKNNLQFHPVHFLNWKEVDQLQQQGHEIGNHTMWHMNIAANTEQTITEDLNKSLQILKSRCSDVKHFAFPFGRFFHFSKIGKAAVFASGHLSCATAERGCHVSNNTAISPQDLCIRRDHVVMGWSMGHIMYFLAQSAKKATPSNNFYPADFI